ncbi:MAG: helix-turn-helix domain-containing protein [Lachnospiraceae bacterium]|nr:helix-turn-helix domain-containing protein [Lachnospiraceae bacterium]
MAAKKVGQLIKEARTAAGLTQEQLAKKVKGLSAADISKAERSEVTLTQAQLKEIAKATGVTQKSLLDAPQPKGKPAAGAKTESSSKKTSSSKTSSSKTGSSKKTSSKSDSSSGTSIKVNATEKKLVTLYRKADADTKKAVMELLKKDDSNEIGGILGKLLDNKDIKDALSGLESLQSLL